MIRWRTIKTAFGLVATLALLSCGSSGETSAGAASAGAERIGCEEFGELTDRGDLDLDALVNVDLCQCPELIERHAGRIADRVVQELFFVAMANEPLVPLGSFPDALKAFDCDTGNVAPVLFRSLSRRMRGQPAAYNIIVDLHDAGLNFEGEYLRGYLNGDDSILAQAAAHVLSRSQALEGSRDGERNSSE